MTAGLRLGMVVAVGFAVGCGSGSDGPSKASMLCKAEIAVMCNRTFTCPGRAELYTSWTSEADCNAQSDPSCDGPTTCIVGTYHEDKDQQCLDAMNAITCADLGTAPGGLLPPVCQQVCTTS